MNRKNIAILGATGHIAKSLIYQWLQDKEHNLYLFARDTDKVNKFLLNLNDNNEKLVSIKQFTEFEFYDYDVIINCVGIADPAKIKNEHIMLFRLTETIDNQILDYLKNNQKCLYINMSSIWN